jgi:hypothetical protein
MQLRIRQPQGAPVSDPLRLGVIPTIGLFLLPRLMPVLRDAFPRLRLHLREDTTARLVERLEARRTGWMCCCLRCRAIAAVPRGPGFTTGSSGRRVRG